MLGGEFELDHPVFGSTTRLNKITHGLQGTWSTSGRSALGHVLRFLQKEGVDHVHLPSYLCESILRPVQALGLNYSFYPVDGRFVAYPDPPKGSAVLLIHYFGKINEATPALRAESGSSFHLIEDACHALLSAWQGYEDRRIFYLISPRKFGPTPLGGWCNVHVSSDQYDPSFENECLISLAARVLKASYLSQRADMIDESIEQTYLRAFEQVESKLEKLPLGGPIPDWILHIIAGINWPEVAQTRVQNFVALSDALRNCIETPFESFNPYEVPLGHPIILRDRDMVRSKLSALRVFCPIHWHLPGEVSKRSFPESYMLSRRCLTLPIDQRYKPDHMFRLAAMVKELT